MIDANTAKRQRAIGKSEHSMVRTERAAMFRANEQCDSDNSFVDCNVCKQMFCVSGIIHGGCCSICSGAARTTVGRVMDKAGKT